LNVLGVLARRHCGVIFRVVGGGEDGFESWSVWVREEFVTCIVTVAAAVSSTSDYQIGGAAVSGRLWGLSRLDQRYRLQFIPNLRAESVLLSLTLLFQRLSLVDSGADFAERMPLVGGKGARLASRANGP
jgi:hypothetical protein